MENKITQLRKGILELAILGALSRSAHYGYSLGRVLAGNDTIDLKEGTIYPLLSRLAKEGLVRTRWVESREGPPRKYYELTIEGERVFRALIEEFHRLESLVERSLRPGDDGASTSFVNYAGLPVEIGKDQPRHVITLASGPHQEPPTEKKNTLIQDQASPAQTGDVGGCCKESVLLLPHIGIEFPPSGQVSVPLVFPPTPRDHTGVSPDAPEEYKEIPKEDNHES